MIDMDLVPAQGGSYQRDPETGALVRIPDQAELPVAEE